MDVDYFQTLLINVTFYLQYVWKLIGNVLIKKMYKTNIIGTGGWRVKVGRTLNRYLHGELTELLWKAFSRRV